MESNLDVVQERHSVRNYLDKEIDNDIVKKLNKKIKEYNYSADLNIQLVLNDSSAFDGFVLNYGRFHNVKNYLAMIAKKSKKIDETIGYYGEKLVLYAQKLGLNTCWVGGTYNKKKVNAVINPDEKLVCVIAIGYGVNDGVKHKIKSFDKVSITTDVPAWYKKGIEYALLAPTAMNLQRFRFELLDKNVVVVKTANDSMAKIDKGIVKYHFELGAGKKFTWFN